MVKLRDFREGEWLFKDHLNAIPFGDTIMKRLNCVDGILFSIFKILFYLIRFIVLNFKEYRSPNVRSINGVLPFCWIVFIPYLHVKK